MTDLDLTAVVARNEGWRMLCNVSAESAVLLIDRLNATARDVPALVAEVERLQNEVRVLTGTEDANLAIVQAENQRLRDVVDKARAWREQFRPLVESNRHLFTRDQLDLIAAVDALDGGG